ncbi:PIN domain-like protein [Scheffersomyces coipomensis]|uniref:PIN domain-like protein n=1 Tax=Scheffersomyces coipomensis TaxID=1788519 RepID=UPI00315CDA33
MGVTGLLPNLKDIQEAGTLERYRGKTLAIDTYGWLHRGLVSCAQELCQDKPTTKYITSIMNKVAMLKHFGVEPYFVFDGAALPTKADTANERRSRRVEALRKAQEYEKNNKSSLAWKEYMKAACVTSQMAKSLMVEFDNHKIKYVVAPYEADPQMVYLEKIGLVDGILSEDSDLLIFGCNKLITKLKDSGSCVEICRENFSKVSSLPYLSKYTQEQLRLVAMLSGCDYTKGVAGVGLKSAFNLVKKYNNLDKVLIALRADGKTINDDFKDEVFKADLAFQFQKVFNPTTNTLETLNPYPENFDTDFDILESCCGKTFTHEHYQKVCNGFLDPNSHEILVSREQNLFSLKSKSVNLGSASQSTSVASRSKSTGYKSAPVKHSIIDMLGAMKAPVKKATVFETPVKRPSESKVSPTARKIQKLSPADQPKSDGISKFFTSNTVTKEESSMNWDISGESEFSEFTAQPSNDKSKEEEVPPNTDNILDELTDNDEEDIGTDELLDDNEVYGSDDDPVVDSLPKPEVSIPSSKDSDDFELSDEDIEESPIKPKVNSTIVTNNLRQVRTSLRESFSYGHTKEFIAPVTTRVPLSSKSINQAYSIKDTFKSKASLSQITKTTTATTTASIHSSQEILISNTTSLKGSVAMKKSSGINSLKRFAFQR